MKRKKTLQTILVIFLVLIVVSTAYAITVDKVLAWGAGAWSGTSRIIPSLVKIAGGQGAGTFYRIAFGWPGVAVMATCLAGQYMWDHRNDEGALGDAIRAFLGYMGYRATSTGVQKGTLAGEGNLTPNAAASSAVASFLSQYPGIQVYWFTTAALADAAQGGSYWCTYGGYMTYINSGTNTANAECRAVTRHNGTHPPGTHTGIGRADYGYMAFCYPKGAGAVTADTTWTDKTVGQMATDAEAKLNDGTQDATEKALWEEVEKKIGEALRTNDRTILDRTNSTGKKVEDAVKEQTEAAVNAESTPEEDSVGVIEAIMNLTNTIVEEFGKLANTISTAVSSALGLNDAVDVSTTAIDANENDTVTDTAIITSEINTQKEATEGYLDALFDSVSGLADRMKDKIETMVGAGSGVCSLQFSVYGQTQTLDFCNIDFSAIHTAVLFVATVAAAMIIIL